MRARSTLAWPSHRCARPSCASRPPICGRAPWTPTTSGSKPTPASAPWPAPNRYRCLRPLVPKRRASADRNQDPLDLPALARLCPAEIVPQDLRVVEAERLPGDLGFRVPARVLRVIGGLERAAAHAAGVDGGDGVLTRIPPRVGVGE